MYFLLRQTYLKNKIQILIIEYIGIFLSLSVPAILPLVAMGPSFSGDLGFLIIKGLKNFMIVFLGSVFDFINIVLVEITTLRK